MFILSSNREKKEAQEYFVQNADFSVFYKLFDLWKKTKLKKSQKFFLKLLTNKQKKGIIFHG